MQTTRIKIFQKCFSESSFVILCEENLKNSIETYQYFTGTSAFTPADRFGT